MSVFYISVSARNLSSVSLLLSLTVSLSVHLETRFMPCPLLVCFCFSLPACPFLSVSVFLSYPLETKFMACPLLVCFCFSLPAGLFLSLTVFLSVQLRLSSCPVHCLAVFVSLLLLVLICLFRRSFRSP